MIPMDPDQKFKAKAEGNCSNIVMNISRFISFSHYLSHILHLPRFDLELCTIVTHES